MQSMLQVVMPMLPIRTYSKDKHLALLAKFSRCYGPVGLYVPQELIAKYRHLALRCLQNALVVKGQCVPQELIAKDKHLSLRCLQKAIVVTGLCFPRKPLQRQTISAAGKMRSMLHVQDCGRIGYRCVGFPRELMQMTSCVV